MLLISSLAAVVAPAFLISLAGFVWAKRGLSFDQIMVTRLMTLVAAPSLVFSIFTKMRLPLREIAGMGAASVGCMVLFGLAGAIGLKIAGLQTKIYLPSLMFPNVGNMGLPICLFAFGERGMALAMVYFAVSLIGQFTFGPGLAAGRLDPLGIFKLPFIYVAMVAVVMNAFGVEPPAWLANTTSLMGDTAVPLMLMALGVAIAELKVANLGRATVMSLARVLLGAAGGWAVAGLFGLEGNARGVLVVQSAMPVAVFNYLFACLYGNGPEEVAGMVVVSTAIAYLVLPALVAVLA